MGKIILVTGGARSGKSLFAERLAFKIGGGKGAYIATAQIFDEEMKARVEMHKARRDENWKTFEAPFEAHEKIFEAGKTFKAILFDCVTMYVSNFTLMLKANDEETLHESLHEQIQKLITASKQVDSTTIFVTNEVGSGIVPENKLARHFRDLAGLSNQMLSNQAEKVFFTIAGNAIDIKKIAERF